MKILLLGERKGEKKEREREREKKRREKRGGEGSVFAALGVKRPKSLFHFRGGISSGVCIYVYVYLYIYIYTYTYIDRYRY